jgi:hypothetical protein
MKKELIIFIISLLTSVFILLYIQYGPELPDNQAINIVCCLFTTVLLCVTSLFSFILRLLRIIQ